MELSIGHWIGLIIMLTCWVRSEPYCWVSKLMCMQQFVSVRCRFLICIDSFLALHCSHYSCCMPCPAVLLNWLLSCTRWHWHGLASLYSARWAQSRRPVIERCRSESCHWTSRCRSCLVFSIQMAHIFGGSIRSKFIIYLFQLDNFNGMSAFVCCFSACRCLVVPSNSQLGPRT